MGKIKCCYLMCEFNSATKDENGIWDCTEDGLGNCNCEKDIILGSYECMECGNEEDGLQCMNYISKAIKD